MVHHWPYNGGVLINSSPLLLHTLSRSSTIELSCQIKFDDDRSCHQLLQEYLQRDPL